MKFSIITPTYKRADNLMRAVTSLKNQTYTDWEMIIVNDSPTDTSYSHFASTINDSRIRYYVNEKNYGVNYSRNRALDVLAADSTWVIFLDDDDYFAPDTLLTFYNLIKNNGYKKWFVTNRAQTNGSPSTRFPKNNTEYSYAWDYLITKKCKGDATHCINTNLLHAIRFSRKIKQAEEWFFFYQVGLRTSMYYHDHNSTISDGYGSGGLNTRKRTTAEQLETILILFYESVSLGLIFQPLFILYVGGRVLRAFIRHD